jgi:DNA (cytosine-5)-methyltransferase 1
VTKPLTHASFFSGVGGLDLGFENAGIKTVSVSEIDPFAIAVLKTRFPSVPHLGDIVELADRELSSVVQPTADVLQRRGGPTDSEGGATSSDDWKTADIWSGGFPCQDLSVAGKRKGFEDGKRSVLAFTFLNLVERYRPRWLVLENVPGLFSSNDGRDFARLLREMDELGYGVSWRTLDARYFGVPQRRRRVFIVASLGTDLAGQVLLECEGGCGHPQESRASWAKTPTSLGQRTEVAGALLARYSKGVNSTIESGQLILGGDHAKPSAAGAAYSSQADASGVREANGMGGWVDNPSTRALGAAVTSEEDFRVEHNAYSIREDATKGNFSATPTNTALSLNAVWPSVQSHHAQTFIASAYRKSRRAQSVNDDETWVDDGVANTLNTFDMGDVRTTHAVVSSSDGGGPASMLPEGMDSNRYRVCGNGVVSNVAEWVAHRLSVVDEKYRNLK